MSTDTIFMFAMVVYALMAAGTFLEFRRMGKASSARPNEGQGSEHPTTEKV